LSKKNFFWTNFLNNFSIFEKIYIFSLLLYISAFTILLSFLLIYNNWKINKTAVYLSLFLLCVSIYGIAHYFVLYGKSPFWLAIFYNHFTPLMLMLGPLLFFYVRGTLYNSSKLHRWDFIHCIPALIHLIGIIPYFIQPFDKKLQIAEAIISDVDLILSVDSNFLFSTAFNFSIRAILLLLYIIYCSFLVWKRFNDKKLAKNMQAKSLVISLRWLVVLLSSLFLIVTEFLIITYNSVTIKPSVGLRNSYPLYILSGIAYFTIAFSLLLFPKILYGITKKNSREQGGEKMKFDKKNENPVNSISIEEGYYFELTEDIKEYLNKEKIFLNRDFSIVDIALGLKISENEVIYCITNVLQTKFTTLRSDLRIDNAIKLLSNLSDNNLTIEGIAQQSGFKTRASFYKAFKDKTGMNPTEFMVSKKIRKTRIGA
jgi:AraC-like DNA-binding protein